jgi:hypothetical protein
MIDHDHKATTKFGADVDRQLPPLLAAQVIADLAASGMGEQPAGEGPSPYGSVEFWAGRAREAHQRARVQRTVLEQLFGGPVMHNMARALQDVSAALDALDGRVASAARCYAGDFAAMSATVEGLRDLVVETLGHVEELVDRAEGRARRSGRPVSPEVAEAQAHAAAVRSQVDRWS